jgi:hypothetical protein
VSVVPMSAMALATIKPIAMSDTKLKTDFIAHLPPTFASIMLARAATTLAAVI